MHTYYCASVFTVLLRAFIILYGYYIFFQGQFQYCLKIKELKGLLYVLLAPAFNKKQEKSDVKRRENCCRYDKLRDFRKYDCRVVGRKSAGCAHCFNCRMNGCHMNHLS